MNSADLECENCGRGVRIRSCLISGQLRTNMRECFILPLSSLWVWKVIILSLQQCNDHRDYATYMFQSVPLSSDYNGCTNHSISSFQCLKFTIKSFLVENRETYRSFDHCIPTITSRIYHSWISFFCLCWPFSRLASCDTWKHTVMFIISGVLGSISTRTHRKDFAATKSAPALTTPHYLLLKLNRSFRLPSSMRGWCGSLRTAMARSSF